MRRSGERAAELTHQLLAYSRKQVLVPKLLNVNSVVENMTNMLRRLIGDNIDLVSAPDPELGLVKADPGQLEQLIMNLVVNAKDAMPDGGPDHGFLPHGDLGPGFGRLASHRQGAIGGAGAICRLKRFRYGHRHGR